MVNIVAYVGSRNPMSSTLRSVKLTKQSLDSEFTADWTILTPNDIKILPVDGTGREFTEGIDYVEEARIDDSHRLKELFKSCDYLILGSPTYGHNVSGDMKIVMDRLTYWGHLFYLAPKPGMAFVSATTNGFLKVGSLLELFMENLGIVISPTVYNTTSTPFDQKKAIETANTILSAGKDGINGKMLEPSVRQEAAFQMLSSTYSRRDSNDCEAKYWREHGFMKCESLNDYFRLAAR